jgi:hypothetical protein
MGELGPRGIEQLPKRDMKIAQSVEAPAKSVDSQQKTDSALASKGGPKGGKKMQSGLNRTFKVLPVHGRSGNPRSAG